MSPKRCAILRPLGSLRTVSRGQGKRYTFVADFHGSVRITPLHDTARLRFQLQNLDGFEAISRELSAIDIGSARMDELARWIAGQPHAFLKDAQNLRRTDG